MKSRYVGYVVAAVLLVVVSLSFVMHTQAQSPTPYPSSTPTKVSSPNPTPIATPTGTAVPAKNASTPCFYHDTTYNTLSGIELGNITQPDNITVTNTNPATILQTFRVIGKLGCLNYLGSPYFPRPRLIVLDTGSVLLNGPELEKADWRQTPESGAGVGSSVISPYTSYNPGQSQIIKNEDKIIEYIAKNKKIIFRDPGYISSDPAYNLEIPATNCVHIGGNGPVKVVFMRGNYGTYSVVDFLKTVDFILTEGFKTIDPFRTYYDRMSFYVDLKRIDEHDLPQGYNSRAHFTYQQGAVDMARGQSSCLDTVPPENGTSQYFLISNAPDVESNAYYGKRMSFLSNSSGVHISAIHEAGHTFGGLLDEYGPLHEFSFDSDFENCSLNPDVDFRNETDNLMYGLNSDLAAGCEQMPNVIDIFSYKRPSIKSIMNTTLTNADDDNRFNVVSCGYIISYLLGEYTSKNNAEKHWPRVDMLDSTMPGCSSHLMNTIKDGVVLAKPGATVLSVNAVADKINTFSVSASNLDAKGNAVKLKYVGAIAEKNLHTTLAAAFDSGFQNFFATLQWLITGTDNRAIVAAPQAATTPPKTYDIPGLPSDGTTLTFQIPPEVPVGKYKVSVGAFNSDWTDTAFTVTVTTQTPGDPGTPDPDPNPNPGTPYVDPGGPYPTSLLKPTFNLTVVDSSQIRLSITNSTPYPISATAKRYPGIKIFQSGSLIKTVGGTSYTVSGLSQETKYCFTVQFVAGPVTSVLSQSLCGTTKAPGAAGGTPTSLVAKEDAKGRMTLTWKDNSSNETGFVIQGYVTPPGTVYGPAFNIESLYGNIAVVAANTNTAYIGVVASTKYTYRIGAMFADGTVPRWSNTDTLTTGGSNTVASVLKAVPTSQNSIDLSWTNGDDKGQVSYELYHSTTVGQGIKLPLGSATVKAVTVTNLPLANTEYCFYVNALIAYRAPTPSKVVCATTLSPSATLSFGTTAPTPLSGTVPFSVATDAQGVTSVELYYAANTGDVKIATLTSGPWNFSIDTTTIPNANPRNFYAIVKMGTVSIQTAKISRRVQN